MNCNLKQFLYWSILAVLVLGFCCAFYWHLDKFFNYSFLKVHHDLFLTWVHNNYFHTLFLFMLTYIAVVAFSLPFALIMTILGGFLFGPLAILYVVASATVGATILFWAVQTTLGHWVAQSEKPVIKHLQNDMKKNALYYLLAARLIPIFPFWLVNIAAGLLGVMPHIFILATFFGVIPGTIIYVMIGNSLHIFFSMPNCAGHDNYIRAISVRAVTRIGSIGIITSFV